MVEFGRGKELYPFSRIVGAEDAKIGFKFLIGPFSLSVGLRMVGSRESYVIVEEACKFLCKGRSELGATIQDEGVMKTKAFEYKVKKQLCDSYGVNGFLARCKNYPLHKAMVDHDHDRIKSCRRGEIGDEVNRELFEGKSNSGLDQEQRGHNGVRVGLVLLADGTTGDKMLHEGGEARPPEISLQDCFHTKNTHVTQQRGGVNGVEEGRASRGGYEHAIAEEEMSIIKGPVRKGGTSEQGRPVVQSGEGLEYKGIGGGGGFNVTS